MDTKLLPSIPANEDVFSQIKALSDSVVSPTNNQPDNSDDVFSQIKALSDSATSSTNNLKLTEKVWPDFLTVSKQIADQRGFPAEVLQGQAALESGRGTSGLTMKDQNYFGIKAHGKYASSNWNTQEADSNGNYRTENDAFAKYNSPQESINDYINLVTSYPGVKEAMATGNKMAVLQAIRAAGYATSPTYVQDVANTPEFQGGKQ